MSDKITNLKKITHKILHWINVAIITLALIIASLFLTLHFGSPQLNKHHEKIEKFTSEAIHQPIKIGNIKIGRHGLIPVFSLQNVVIFNDDKTKKILNAQELQIGINIISSLIKWKVKPGIIVLKGSNIKIDQKEYTEIDKNKDKTDIAKEVLLWLTEQKKIYLENIKIDLKLIHGGTIKISDLSLKLDNDIFHKSIRIKGFFEQEDISTNFSTNLKLNNDFFQKPLSYIKGNLTIENLNYKSDKKNSLQLPFFPPSGEIDLSIKNSNVKADLFRQPIAITNLSSKVIWKQYEDHLKINAGNLKFEDEWFNAKGNVSLDFSKGSNFPTSDISLNFDLKNLNKAKLYYPVKLLPPKATEWLDTAFTNSKKISGNMVLKGPLDKFPFDNNEGQFLINSVLRDVDLKFDKDWPLVNNINGTMVFSKRTMTIIANSGKILGEPTNTVKAVIPDLNLPFLHITGSIKGDSEMGLRFINSCPLKETVGQNLKEISLSGPMELDLKIDMPLSDNISDQNTYVKGNIDLNENELISEWGFKIDNLNGNLTFDTENLESTNLQGNLFNKPVTLSIKTLESKKKKTFTRVEINGEANVRDFEKSFSIKIHPFAFGHFNYKALLDITEPSKANIFDLTSNLKGVRIRLPEPYNKSRAEEHMFNLKCIFGDKIDTQVSINYNDQINSALKVKKISGDKIKVLGGEVKFGKSTAKIPKKPELEVTGKIAELDWATWKEYLSKAEDNRKEGVHFTDLVNLKLGKLYIFGETFENVSLKIKPTKKGQEVYFLTKDIDGKIYIPNNTKEHIIGDFKKLHIKTTDEENIVKFEPYELSQFKLKINDFRYNDIFLKKLEIITEAKPNGLKFSKIEFGDKIFSMKGSGEWLVTKEKQSSHIKGNFKSKNIGSLLKEWKLSNNVYGGDGRITFSLKWPDSPYKLDLKNALGYASIDVTNGRIINLSKQTENKLGLGRILNVLSLQSLPRRLTLDFSDLSTQGFAFDTLKTEVELSDGNATIKNLTMEGPVATIKAYGIIGLENQDFNIMLGAAPQLTSSIPIVAAAAVNPIAGFLGLIADQFISSAIKKTAAYNYHITGPWKNPVITKK